MGLKSFGGGKPPFTTIAAKDYRPFKVIGVGGHAGSGKTVMAGLAGSGKKVLVLDLEGGSSTYSGKFFKEHPDASNIEVVDLFDMKYNDPTQLVAGVIGPLEYLAGTKNKEGYHVVVVDSLTEFSDKFVNNFQGDGYAKYGKLAENYHRMLQFLQAIPAHTVVTSRVNVKSDDVLGHDVVRFNLSDKAWMSVSGLLDIIGYKHVQMKGFGTNLKEVHVFDTRQGARFQGKDRFGIGELVDPTMKKIIEIVEGDDT